MGANLGWLIQKFALGLLGPPPPPGSLQWKSPIGFRRFICGWKDCESTVAPRFLGGVLPKKFDQKKTVGCWRGKKNPDPKHL